MSILKIARLGHPILRTPARELTREEILSPGTRQLMEDMIETMYEYGGIGLAAPQVHQPIQFAIIEFKEESERYPNMGTQPLSFFFNPKITVLDSTEQSYWEGCLSIPEMRGLVQRPRKIKVDFLDAQAKPQSVTAEGFLATVFQHELDHLSGRLFIDRMKDMTKLAFLEEYRRHWLPAENSNEGELEE